MFSSHFPALGKLSDLGFGHGFVPQKLANFGITRYVRGMYYHVMHHAHARRGTCNSDWMIGSIERLCVRVQSTM